MMEIKELVGAYEAKTRFFELLDRAVEGSAFTITRHGKAVAVIQPIQSPVQDRAGLLAECDILRTAILQGGGQLSVRQLRDEGRR